MLRGIGVRVAAGLSMVAAAVPALGASSAIAGKSGPIEVIVQAVSPGAAVSAVSSVGGRVLTALPIVSGVAADVPASDLATLAHSAGVEQVTPDSPLTVAGTNPAATSALTVSGTPSVYDTEVGATGLAGSGDTGSGAVVALIDTGITPGTDLAGQVVTGLENPSSPNGPVVNCINFSGDSTCNDGYGHGTFMAGLIAGTGAASKGTFAGVAPGAKLINLKVASSDGSTDLARVLGAIDWAVSFRQQYNISILNLSLGATPNDSPSKDPLDEAVEAAWNAGLAVITSAGNAGPGPGTITAPGDDPAVITVGATDDLGTASPADDTVPSYSSRGPTASGAAKPDVVAPGNNVIGLQAAGSYVSSIPTEADLTAPNYSGVYRRGSGTSMATAITSGAAALLYSQWSAQPGFSAASWPNRLKAALTSTASAVSSTDPNAVGAGLVNAAAAVGSTAQGSTPPGGSNNYSGYFTPSSWYSGPFSGQSWEGQSWEGQSWEGQSWEGQSWEGQSWEGQSWEGQSWEGQSWEGQSWEGQSWEGQSWEGVNWG